MTQARAPTAPRKYRQIDLLRDGALILYVVYMLSGGILRLAFSGGGAYGGGSILNQGITALMLGAAILCCLYERASFRRLLLGSAPYILPTALILVSILWSDHVSIGMRRAVRFCIEIVGLLMLVSCYRDSRSFLRMLWFAFAILVGLDIAAAAVPSMSLTSIGYAGVHGHKNTLGSFCYAAIPVFFIGWRMKLLGRWSLLSLGIMLLACLLLLVSLSKTAIALVPISAVLAFVGYYIWRRGLTTQMAAGAMFFAFVLVIATPLASTGMNLAEAIGALTGDPTMTGRTEVWDYTFWRVGDRALTGVGYGSFWDVDASAVELMNQYGVTFAFNQAHNGYIGVFAELGWLGIGAIVLTWVMATSAILRRITNRAEWPLVGYGLYTALGYLLYNVTETSFFRVGFDTWVEFVLVSAAVAKLVQPMRPVRQRAIRRTPHARVVTGAAP